MPGARPDVREAILLGGARAYYDLMSVDERDAIDGILRFLEDDPPVDRITVFDAPDAPDVRAFDNGTWRIGYQIPDNATIAVFALRHVLDLPS